MAEYLIQSETLDDIADAINAKTGGSSAMTPAQMVTAIGSIQTGGAGNGEVLLASGTYTKAENGSRIDIPVSYSGTYSKMLVVKDSIESSDAATFEFCLLKNNGEIDDAFGEIKICRVKASGGNPSTQMNNSVVLTATLITCIRYSQSYKVLAGTYSWYIWGVAS